MIKEAGQAFLLVLIVVAIVLVITITLIGGATLYFQNATYSVNTEKATALAEAGVDKALASLNRSGGNYNGEIETKLDDGSYSVTITTKDAGTKIIESTGYLPDKTNPKVKRTVRIQVSTGVGISFIYGLQVGEGGLEMGNGATLNGSVYSNGNIVGGTNTTITGDVWVAGGGQASADQQSDCTGVNCQNFIFGKVVGGESRQDTAQSFKPGIEGVINKVSLKLKKNGSPANPTVRLMKDSNGKPDKNNVLASGTLQASLVTAEYSFVDVNFTQTPNLENDKTYWIMIHSASLDSSNYWSWSLDLASSYTRGQAKWSPNWQAGSPVWNVISGDLGFKVFMGGVATSVNLSNGSRVNGSVHANTITGQITISGDAYYQTLGPSVTVNGIKYPSSPDSAPVSFPISDANIAAWKLEAEQAGVTAGSLAFGNSCTPTLGPGKITGSVSFGNGCTVTVKSPLWIAGALSAGNTTRFVLDSSYGASSGMIIVDGATSLGNGGDFRGSGTAGSYLMLLSTYSGEAVDIGNSAISGIIYAPYGSVELANGASFKEISAWKIELGNNAILNYQSGLAQTFFSSGPSGSYSLVKGTYQIK